MPPRLVRCTCDPAWPAMAVCETCELAALEARMRRRGVVQYDPDPDAARRDADDRAWVAAQERSR